MRILELRKLNLRFESEFTFKFQFLHLAFALDYIEPLVTGSVRKKCHLIDTFRFLFLPTF